MATNDSCQSVEIIFYDLVYLSKNKSHIWESFLFLAPGEIRKIIMDIQPMKIDILAKTGHYRAQRPAMS